MASPSLREAACYLDLGHSSSSSTSASSSSATITTTPMIIGSVALAILLTLLYRLVPSIRRTLAVACRAGPWLTLIVAVGGHWHLLRRAAPSACPPMVGGTETEPPTHYALSLWGPIESVWPPAPGAVYAACDLHSEAVPARIALSAISTPAGAARLRASIVSPGYAIVTGLAAPPPHAEFGAFFARPAAEKQLHAGRFYDGRCRCVGYCEQGAFRSYVEIRDASSAAAPSSSGAFAAATPALREAGALARAALRVLAPAALPLVDPHASLWRVHNYSRRVGVTQRTHADLGFVTVARKGSAPGLEVAVGDGGGWRSLDDSLGPHDALVFGGKQLALVTGGAYRPLRHRVNLGSSSGVEHRLSSLYFLRARPDAMLRPLLGLEREAEAEAGAGGGPALVDRCGACPAWEKETAAGVAAHSLEFR